MHICLRNLGVLRQAEFDIGDFTVICGQNNTGKTYATYALYGFLSEWRDLVSIPVPNSVLQQLLSDGIVNIDIRDYIGSQSEYLNSACDRYVSSLPRIFA